MPNLCSRRLTLQADPPRQAAAVRLSQTLGFTWSTSNHATTLRGQLSVWSGQIQTERRTTHVLCLSLHRLPAPLRRRVASVNVGLSGSARSLGRFATVGVINRKRWKRTQEQSVPSLPNSPMVRASKSAEAGNSPARHIAPGQGLHANRPSVCSQRAPLVCLSGRCHPL